MAHTQLTGFLGRPTVRNSNRRRNRKEPKTQKSPRSDSFMLARTPPEGDDELRERNAEFTKQKTKTHLFSLSSFETLDFV